MKVHMTQPDVLCAWITLGSGAVPRNRFDLHISVTEKLEPKVTELSPVDVRTKPWSGTLTRDEIGYLKQKAADVERFPGNLVKPFKTYEGNLDLWEAAAAEDDKPKAKRPKRTSKGQK